MQILDIWIPLSPSIRVIFSFCFMRCVALPQHFICAKVHIHITPTYCDNEVQILPFGLGSIPFSHIHFFPICGGEMLCNTAFIYANMFITRE
jgi:hypothetical protein